MRGFTPRAALHRGDFVGEARPVVRMTRRGGDETSFGLVGRLTITIVLASMLLALLAFTIATGLTFLYPTAVVPGALVCAWILKETWRAVHVGASGYRAPIKLADVAEAMRPPSFRGMSVGRRVAVVTGIAGSGAVVLVYFQLHHDTQVGVVMFLGLLGVGLLAAAVLRRD